MSTTVRRTFFNLLYQPKRVGRRRIKRVHYPPVCGKMYHGQHIAGFRRQHTSRRNLIIGRHANIKSAVLSAKIGRVKRIARSFMTRRFL